MAKKGAADFVLDVHTEPLPARFVPPAVAQLKAAAERFLSGRIEHGEVSARGTLRHLVLTVAAVAPKGRDVEERFKGPKAGAPPQAVEGFARKHGLAPAALREEGGVIYAVVSRKGEPARAVLSAMIPEILAALAFPKTMVWEETGFRFGRPIRAFLALHGRSEVPVSVAGAPSGRLVHGHPALGRKPAALKDASRHEAALRAAGVLLDPAERRAELEKALAGAARPAGGVPEPDEPLLEETLYMVERPTAVLGSLRAEHMRLPPELIKLVMKKQLKFFPVLGPEGALLPSFIGVRDGPPKGNALVAEGYRRVIEARFNDAAFFVARDAASPLADKLAKLERVTYQKALGTMAQKAARVAGLAAWLAERLRSAAAFDEAAVSRAAGLVYADLVTEVVKEFPELQGVIGGEYARRDGLGEAVAACLEGFYLPLGPASPLPATPEACLVSLAGKLDGLAGCFAAGLLPTGSADPFGLRRQALGALRIVLERGFPLDLEEALSRALSLQPVAAEPKAAAQLADFLWGRAQGLFEEAGFSVDEVRAVRAGALRDLPRAARRLKALRAARRDPAFESLAASFKRAANILKQAGAGGSFERGALAEAPELALYDALEAAEKRSTELEEAGDLEAALMALAAVKPALDGFFEKLLVLAEDPAARARRLGLLARLARAFTRLADLAELQSPGA